MKLAESKLPVYNRMSKIFKRGIRVTFIVILLAGFVWWSLGQHDGFFKGLMWPIHYSFLIKYKDEPDSLCPVVNKIDPTTYLYDNSTLEKILVDEGFRNQTLNRLQRAVQIPTQIFDGMVLPELVNAELDDNWQPFDQFHEYLESSFPLVHKNLKLEKINRLGLVYTWEGSNALRKPIMLAAHYDVVPVEPGSISQWKFPPFKGVYDGKYIYGRGVADCKSLLVGLMETIELLLSESQFTPRRTIILSFGYDEEAAGHGAEGISKHLLNKYGESSFLQIIDEGDTGYVEIQGDKYILPGTSEKGHLNSIIELFTPGGHSSVPPKHTSIGLISRIIGQIEDEEFESVISNVNPVLRQLQCVAEHSQSVDPALRKTIMKAHLDKNANKELLNFLSRDLYTKYTVTTSQAIDIINGGAKSNSLPEYVSVLINHRIALEESVSSTRQKVVSQVQKFAEEYDLGLLCDGEIIMDETDNGFFNYTTNEPLEPAPLTPVGGFIWDVFGGSLRYLYEDLLSPGSNETFIFAPYIGTGNTDTKSYWQLTKNIFRYVPGAPSLSSNIHSVDENLDFDSHLHIIAFYYYYLQVLDKLSDPETETFAGE